MSSMSSRSSQVNLFEALQIGPSHSYPELMTEGMWTELMKSTGDPATENWRPFGMKPVNHITIIALEGTHGIGKSTILNEVRKKGYFVLDELFEGHADEFEPVIEEDVKPRQVVDERSKYPFKNYHIFAKELKWTGDQFDKLADIGEKWRVGDIRLKDNLVFVDRSFLTPMIYGRLTEVNYFMFSNICRELIRFLESEYFMYYKIVRIDRLLADCIEDQMAVIRARAKREPWRVQLSELSANWLWRVSQAYHQLDRVVDRLVILNAYGVDTPEEEAEKILTAIKPLTI